MDVNDDIHVQPLYFKSHKKINNVNVLVNLEKYTLYVLLS